MAQVIFAAIGQVWSSVQMVKIVMAGFEAITIVALVAAAAPGCACPAPVSLVYAWNPLPLWEYAGNGHIDAASLAFMSLAMLARISSSAAELGRRRARARDIVQTAAGGGVPGVLAPLGLADARPGRWW